MYVLRCAIFIQMNISQIYRYLQVLNAIVESKVLVVKYRNFTANLIS